MSYQPQLLALTLFGAGTLTTGCISDQAGEAFADAVIAQSLAPRFELAASLTSFIRETGRWPTNQLDFESINQSDTNSTPSTYKLIALEEIDDSLCATYVTDQALTNRITVNRPR